MLFSGKTDIGLMRELNEDSIYLPEDHGALPIFIVADGMGGHRAGEVASAKAVSSVADTINTHMSEVSNANDLKELVSQALYDANREIFYAASKNEDLVGMGTTIDVFVDYGGIALVAHVGDSRVYRLRDGEMTQITSDHSLVAMLVKEGTITPEEALTHPQRNFITRALGTEYTVEPEITWVAFDEGDTVLMCSDGLTNMLNNQEIKKKILDNPNPDDAVAALIDSANAHGGIDNISVIIVKK